MGREFIHRRDAETQRGKWREEQGGGGQGQSRFVKVIFGDRWHRFHRLRRNGGLNRRWTHVNADEEEDGGVDKKRQGSDRIGLIRLNSDKFVYLGEFFMIRALAHRPLSENGK